MPQDVDFSHAAAMFGLAYHRPDDWPSLDEALAGAWRRAGATVIELAVNETDGAQTLQQLLAQGKSPVILSAAVDNGQPGYPWLVFLHGFSGDRNEWRKVGDAFPAWPRLYLDLPGHGGSADIAVQDFAGVNTLLQSTLDSYNIHKYWLIGYSLGGRVAMNFASQPRAGRAQADR